VSRGQAGIESHAGDSTTFILWGECSDRWHIAAHRQRVWRSPPAPPGSQLLHGPSLRL